MADKRVNPTIIKTIRERSPDKAVSDFLIDIVYEEVEHSGGVRKEAYLKKISEYSAKWGSDHEN
jgi:hypothetical protein